LKKREEPLLRENSEFPGGVTWVDREYDPHFKAKVRFARTKAVCLWLRNHVLAAFIIAVFSTIVSVFVARLLLPSTPQSQAHTPQTTTAPSSP
jgi:hypothetical protein